MVLPDDLSPGRDLIEEHPCQHDHGFTSSFWLTADVSVAAAALVPPGTNFSPAGMRRVISLASCSRSKARSGSKPAAYVTAASPSGRLRHKPGVGPLRPERKHWTWPR